MKTVYDALDPIVNGSATTKEKGDRKTRPPFAFYAECYAGVIFDTERARFASERAPLHFLPVIVK